MLLLLLSLAAAQADKPEWRAMAGAQVDADSHGLVDLALRTRDWELGLYTDTLQALWTPAGDKGRSWLGARGEARIAGLLPYPWLEGAPAPEYAQTASYLGLEASIRYGPKGTYAGLQGFGRRYLLGAPDTALWPAAPDVTVLRSELVLGWWTEEAQAWLVLGAHFLPDAVDPVVHGDQAQPHAQLSFSWKPAWTVGPLAEVRAGWAEGQGDLTRTRVGGLNPYVVPLGGAGWGEWWAEDYVALRQGPRFAKGGLELALVADLVWFTQDVSRLEDRYARDNNMLFAIESYGRRFEWGTAALARWQPKRLFVEGSLGWGAGVPRAEGVSPLSGWLLVGMDWGRKASPPG